MHLNVLKLLHNRTLVGAGKRCNQGIAAVAALGLLVACSSGGDTGGSSGFFGGLFGGGQEADGSRSRLVESDLVFFGVAAGDEPIAVQAAEEVLKYGGTAADAAVALSLTLTVTMPSMASLGSGGVCMVHDPSGKETEVIDFIAPPGTSVTGADRPSAVPTLLRGLAALHARYGRQDIRGLLAGAEKLARFGYTVSRATARDFGLAAKPLFNDPSAKAIFGGPNGAPPAEGTRLVQGDLANVYGALRTEGIAGFYKGDLASRLVDAVKAAGGTLTLDDLRNYLPEWRKAATVPYQDLVLAFAPPPAGAGVSDALIWNMLASGDRYRNETADGRAHLLAEASKRAFAARAQWLFAQSGTSPEPFASAAVADRLMANYDPRRATPAASLDPPPVAVAENPSGTGFVVVDVVGQAVACTLTNYGFFGTGRIAPGTGILLAAAPGKGDRNALSLGPAIAYETEYRSFRFAAAGSGGAAATTATAAILAESLLAEFQLAVSVERPRIHQGGLPDVVLAEEAVPKEIVDGLRSRGHEVATVPSLGRINAAECPLGLDAVSEEVACFVYSDRRGYGIAAEAQR
jgi:gamma-glutamyltranspeptidase/glutathione hydrolase